MSGAPVDFYFEFSSPYGYIASQIKAKNKNIVGPIKTNLFLYFAVN